MVRKLRARWLDALLVLIAMGALSLVFAPAVVGYLAVNRLDAALQRLSLLNNVQWTLVSRDQGWFQSRLHTELTFADYAPLQTSMAVEHGPVLPGMLDAQRSPFLMAFVRTRSEDAGGPQFRAALQFNGDWSARLDSQDLALRPLGGNPGLPVTLQSLQADLSYTALHRALGVRAAADNGSIGTRSEFAQLTGLAALGEYRVDVSGWLFGDTSVRAARIVHPPWAGSVTGFELAASSTENGPSAAASVALRAATGHFFERRFGVMELDAVARNVSLNELRTWFHRSDSFSQRALRRLLVNANVRVSQFRIRDPDGDSLMQASAKLTTRPASPRPAIHLSLDLDASRPFAEFVFWHGAKRTLGRSVLFGKLNELEASEQSEVARASAARQLSVLTSRGYLTWNRGWYHARVRFDGDAWTLNDRPVNVR